MTDIAAVLAAAGCLAPEAEAAELRAAARDAEELEALVWRRVQGEPLAWVVGATTFCGVRLLVDQGVYVPRPQTEALARRAASLVPPGGVAVDLCTGSGAVACGIRALSEAAVVVATDIDPLAVDCARANGVDALLGDVDEPLPASLAGRVAVVTAVPPYVPTEAMPFLPRDVLAFEPRAALDGGAGGLRLLTSIVDRSVRWLAPGGWLLLEIGGAQAQPVAAAMEAAGYVDLAVRVDAEGDDRAIEGRRRPDGGQS